MTAIASLIIQNADNAKAETDPTAIAAEARGGVFVELQGDQENENSDLSQILRQFGVIMEQWRGYQPVNSFTIGLAGWALAADFWDIRVHLTCFRARNAAYPNLICDNARRLPME